MMLRVIVEKKDKFELKTLVNVIWTLGKLDVDQGVINDILIEMRDYERLRDNLGGLMQKSQCILMWTYTKSERFFSKEFLLKLCKAMLEYKGPRFELDNFDVLLII